MIEPGMHVGSSSSGPEFRGVVIEPWDKIKGWWRVRWYSHGDFIGFHPPSELVPCPTTST